MEEAVLRRHLSPSFLGHLFFLGTPTPIRDARRSPEQEKVRATWQQPCLKVGEVIPFVVVWGLGIF